MMLPQVNPQMSHGVAIAGGQARTAPPVRR